MECTKIIDWLFFGTERDRTVMITENGKPEAVVFNDKYGTFEHSLDKRIADYPMNRCLVRPIVNRGLLMLNVDMGHEENMDTQNRNFMLDSISYWSNEDLAKAVAGTECERCPLYRKCGNTEKKPECWKAVERWLNEKQQENA